MINKEEMLPIVIGLVLGFILGGYFIFKPKDYKDYTVVITYCNGKIDTTTITDDELPSSSNIETYKQAVPIYRAGGKKYLNICDIKPL